MHLNSPNPFNTTATSDIGFAIYECCYKIWPVFDGKIRLIIDRVSGGNIQIQNLEILSFTLIYRTPVAQKYTRFRKIGTYPMDYNSEK